MSNEPGKNPSPMNRPGLPSRRPPVFILIWLLVIMMMVTLFVYKYTPSVGNRIEWSQTEFEQNLKAGNVVTVVNTPSIPFPTKG